MNRNLRSEADDIIEDLALLELLRQHGEFCPVGSWIPLLSTTRAADGERGCPRMRAAE